ncbi:hypothetical protein [Micromonospora sp. NPDC003241]
MTSDDHSFEEFPLRQAALHLVKESPEGRALKRRLEAFDDLDDPAKEKAAAEIREVIAGIVARAVTEEHHRAEMLNAFVHSRRGSDAIVSDPGTEDQHPIVTHVLEVAEDILAELGKEMLIEAILPGAHLVIPPDDFVRSLFTAVEMIEIQEDPFHRPW